MTEQKKIYVTLSGLPLSFQFDWPFHKSTSGSDFWVLHGDIRLESSPGLHAPGGGEPVGDGTRSITVA